MSTFWAVLKTSILIYKLLLLLFGQLLDIFGLLYISASGHTGCDLNNDASIASIDDRFRGNCHDVGIPTYNCTEKLTSSSRLRDQKFAQRAFYLSQLCGMSLQCGQMTRLFVQYLAIYSNEKLPKSIINLPRWGQNFAPQKIKCS